MKKIWRSIKANKQNGTHYPFQYSNINILILIWHILFQLQIIIPIHMLDFTENKDNQNNNSRYLYIILYI